MIDWGRVRHFKPEEWVHDPDKIAPDVVYLADEMRDAAGVSLIIHVAWDSSGHVSNSGHYAEAREYAQAFDFHFEGWSLLDQWLFAERFPWNGIGLYPYWNTPGLHCDLRRVGRDHAHLGRRWWRDKDGSYQPIDRRLLTFLTTGDWP